MNYIAKSVIIAVNYFSTAKMFGMEIAEKHHKSSACNNCIIWIAFFAFKMTLNIEDLE